MNYLNNEQVLGLIATRYDYKRLAGFVETNRFVSIFDDVEPFMGRLDKDVPFEIFEESNHLIIWTPANLKNEWKDLVSTAYIEPQFHTTGNSYQELGSFIDVHLSEYERF
jgi:hypothetical protein